VQNPSFPYLEIRKQTCRKRALTGTTSKLQKQIKELKSMHTRTRIKL